MGENSLNSGKPNRKAGILVKNPLFRGLNYAF